MHARNALNEMKWSRRTLERAVIFYLHRGAPNDEASVHGSRIVRLGPSFVEFPPADALDKARYGDDNTMIPYHRIRRIEVDGKVVWRR